MNAGQLVEAIQKALERRTEDPVGTAKTLLSLMKANNLDVDQIAFLSGQDFQQMLRDLVRTPELSKDVLKAYRDGKMPFTSLLTYARFTDKINKSTMNKALRQNLATNAKSSEIGKSLRTIVQEVAS